jgi:hypothetical protein
MKLFNPDGGWLQSLLMIHMITGMYRENPELELLLMSGARKRYFQR